MSIMSGLTRPRREPVPPPDPALLAQIDDPDIGSIKRRVLRRIAAGIRTIGPSAPPTPRPPEPPPMADSADYQQHREIVERELAALDEHVKAISARLDTGCAGDFETQELLAERRDLAVLRRELMDDLNHPTIKDRDGRPLSDQMRNYVRARAAENRDELWAAAERAAREGDHRRARGLRHDALRARHIALHEMNLKPGGLRGYSFPG